MQGHLLMSLVGARPQFMKLAPLARLIEDERFGQLFSHFILHTGQHYDHGMSEVFFDELNIPTPNVNLGVGSGSHGAQTGEMLKQIEEVLQVQRPDLLIIFGDTNSTLAGALAAAKLHIPVAHVEAGLRSFNRTMPEEINRIVSDHTSELLLAPTPTAMDNLDKEGLGNRSVFTGDIMHDAVLYYGSQTVAAPAPLQHLKLTPGAYYLATIHRPVNTDDAHHLKQILLAFNAIAAEKFPVVFPLHPRTANRIQQFHPDWTPHRHLHLIDPQGYLHMMQLLRNCRLVFTDSGGLQKEAFFLQRPCITLRPQTEWIETLQAGANVLCPSDKTAILTELKHWEEQIDTQNLNFSEAIYASYGKGDAAYQILMAIAKFLKIPDLPHQNDI